jgi:hypothetical protein
MNKPVKELSYAAFSVAILGVSSPVSTNADTTTVTQQLTSDHPVIQEMISSKMNQGDLKNAHSDGHNDHSDHSDIYSDNY